MEPRQGLRVLELCEVAPPPGSAPATSLPLTFLELLFLVQPPAELLFFYNFPTQTDHFLHHLLPRFKHTLSLTLQHFYPLAGNLTWSPQFNSPIIRYVRGDSVSLVVAESSANFEVLSSSAARSASESRPLIPQLIPSSTKLPPVLALQLTLFQNAGICIAVSAHAAAVDGRSVVSFMKSWASICRFGSNGNTTEVGLNPCYDRSLIRDPKGLGNLFLKEFLKFTRLKISAGSTRSEPDQIIEGSNWNFRVLNLTPPENMVRATFELSGADVARLRNKVILLARVPTNANKVGVEGSTQLPIVSSFALTSACIWVCLVKAKEQEESDEVSILFTVDCRGRLDPPAPETYFGKCIVGVKVNAKRRDIVGENGIAVAVEAIKEGIRKLEDEGVMSIAEQCCSRLLSPSRSIKPVVPIAGSTKFGFYKTDFGLGRPKKVELASMDRTGAVFLAESRNGDGGAEISLVRSKKEMDAFTAAYARGLNDLVASPNQVRSAL